MLGIQPADVKEGTVYTYLEQRDLYTIQHVSQVLARLPRLTDISHRLSSHQATRPKVSGYLALGHSPA